jgi:hypothetical protein
MVISGDPLISVGRGYAPTGIVGQVSETAGASKGFAKFRSHLAILQFVGSFGTKLMSKNEATRG